MRTGVNLSREISGFSDSLRSVALTDPLRDKRHSPKTYPAGYFFTHLGFSKLKKL